MSNLEKFIGMGVMVVVIIVFCLVMITIVAFLNRWKEKKVNPMKNFHCNPKGASLSPDQQRAINVGAILAQTNTDFCDSLETSKPGAKNSIETILARDWEIESEESAVEILESLKNGLHRHIFDIVLKNASEVLSPTYKVKDFQQIYNQVGFSLLNEELRENYTIEIELLEKHIDVLLNAPSFEEVQQQKELFGDDETFDRCMQIYALLQERCVDYVRYTENLKKTLPQLQKAGYVSEVSELTHLNLAAWDMGRMVNVARYSYDCGYITQSQAWDYIFFAEKESARCYSDWSAFGKSYVIGRAMWGGHNLNLFSAMDAVKLLQNNDKSPWKRTPLK